MIEDQFACSSHVQICQTESDLVTAVRDIKINLTYF